MNEFIKMLPLLMTIVGALALTVSVVIEVIKNIGVLAKVPTDIVVIVLSIALSVATFFTYAAVAGIAIVWYYIVGTILGGFFVSFVAMYGWDKLTELIERFKK